MKRVVIFLFLFYIPFQMYSQKEFYFSSPKEDSISIKSLNILNAGFVSSFNEYGVAGAIDIGVIREFKIGKSAVLLAGVSLINSINRVYPDVHNINEFNRIYVTQISFTTEPRWYFDYKKRVMSMKNSKLNTGFFLGLPVMLSTSNLISDNQVKFNLLSAPAIGYRYAIAERFFLESLVGAGFYTDFTVVSPAPYLKLKLSYCFK